MFTVCKQIIAYFYKQYKLKKILSNLIDSKELFKYYYLEIIQFFYYCLPVNRKLTYKLETNFVDIVVMKSKLCLTLNMKFNQILDPNNICKDVSNKGRWGNGDVEITLKKEEDINKVLEIIEQSLDLQME